MHKEIYYFLAESRESVIRIIFILVVLAMPNLIANSLVSEAIVLISRNMQQKQHVYFWRM